MADDADTRISDRGRRPGTRTIDRHIGAQIRARRRCLGITMAQLAANLGISYQQQYKNETGVNHVPATRLYELARILDVRADYFFRGLSIEPLFPARKINTKFLQLVEDFARLSKKDQEIVVGLSRLLSDKRKRPK